MLPRPEPRSCPSSTVRSQARIRCSPALIFTCLYGLGLGFSLLSLPDGARTGSETLLNAGFPIVSSTPTLVGTSCLQLQPTVTCVLFTSVQAVLFWCHHSWDHWSGDSHFLEVQPRVQMTLYAIPGSRCNFTSGLGSTRFYGAVFPPVWLLGKLPAASGSPATLMRCV